MVFLGLGKYARADRIYALQPITGDDRGTGQRTLVWIEGIGDPIVAGRTERTILHVNTVADSMRRQACRVGNRSAAREQPSRIRPRRSSRIG